MSVIRLLLALALLGGCTETSRYSHKKAEKQLQRLEKNAFVLGEFELAADAVLDGDTIKVRGIKTTLRLLGIDTEETFKNKNDRRLAAQDFDAYLKAKRGDSIKPVKAATPLGEEAKKYCKEFLEGVSKVRLERDREKEIRGRYGRYLTYVFVNKNGKDLNYNVESVRAGMSPYFMKYGYSSRFHDEFEQAQKEARAAKRGIWDPNAEGYKDYDERLVWWRARADFIRAFEKNHPQGIALTSWDAIHRLEQAAKSGKPVKLLATVASTRLGDRGPNRVMLARRRGDDFPLIFFDKDLYNALALDKRRGEFIMASGVVKTYTNKFNGQKQMQIIVERPSQITVAPVPHLDKQKTWKPQNDS